MIQLSDSDNIVLIPVKIPGENFHSLEPEFTIVEPINDYAAFSNDELAEILPHTTAIVALTGINSDMIAKALSLKVIVVNGAGFDHIDIAAATARKIPVVNVPDTTAMTTAELTLALMLDVMRKVTENDRQLRNPVNNEEEIFQPGKNLSRNLCGKTLGIVGLGHIGAALAEICSPLKMNMIYTSRHRKPLAIEKGIRFVSFDELVETSDIISIHCPFNKDSENLFSADVFQKMKNGAVLINTARGKIVDYEALIHYLENGKLYGAGLDVFPDEPHIPTRLKQIDNVVLTPHISANTSEARQAIADAVCDVIRKICRLGAGEYPYAFPGLINPGILQKFERDSIHEN
jgi:glyoxylate reductase